MLEFKLDFPLSPEFVTHLCPPVQVLMKIGFVFIGSGGAALLIDDGGLQRLAATDVASMVQKA